MRYFNLKNDRKQKLLTEICHAFWHIHGSILDIEIHFIPIGFYNSVSFTPVYGPYYRCAIGYHYVKMYRNKICGGAISFAHACLFTLFMYMFASLLVAVAHYIYFQFIDHGFIITQCMNDMEQMLVTLPGMETEKEVFKTAMANAQSLSSIDITMQLLSWNVFAGSLLAIPTALFVMKRNRE